MGKPNFLPADGYRSPMPDECRALIDRLQTTSYVEVAPAIETFIQAHVRFARATGISQHLVAAMHQLGMALVAIRDEAACIRAERLARLALHWQPFNAHAWTLWADALEARGVVAASEIVRWEQVRRLPFDVDARAQLAEMLIALDRFEEARTIVDRCFEEGLVNEVVDSLGIRLAAHLDGIEAARETAEAAVKEFPDYKLLADFKSKLVQGENLWVTSFRYQEYPLALDSNALASTGEAGDGMIIRLRDMAHARTLERSENGC